MAKTMEGVRLREADMYLSKLKPEQREHFYNGAGLLWWHGVLTVEKYKAWQEVESRRKARQPGAPNVDGSHLAFLATLTERERLWFTGGTTYEECQAAVRQYDRAQRRDELQSTLTDYLKRVANKPTDNEKYQHHIKLSELTKWPRVEDNKVTNDKSEYEEFSVVKTPEQEKRGNMVRSTDTGKTKFALVYHGPMLRRWAEHLTKGAEIYGDNNWLEGTKERDPAIRAQIKDRYRQSAARHFWQYMDGDRKEDHAAAVIFNLNGLEAMLETD